MWESGWGGMVSYVVVVIGQFKWNFWSKSSNPLIILINVVLVKRWEAADGGVFWCSGESWIPSIFPCRCLMMSLMVNIRVSSRSFILKFMNFQFDHTCDEKHHFWETFDDENSVKTSSTIIMKPPIIMTRAHQSIYFWHSVMESLHLRQSYSIDTVWTTPITL